MIFLTSIAYSDKVNRDPDLIHFSHIRSLGAAGALAVDICICFHDIESYIFAKLFPSLAV